MKVNILMPFKEASRLEAGCDEAGRGCLAGPVLAAAVILPEGFYHPVLNDSKQLSLKQREILRPIIEATAIWAVGRAEPAEIDEINILNASFLAMHRDDFMLQIHREFPVYHWDHNKGYPTREHRDAIRVNRACAYHRKSFRLLDEQLKLFLTYFDPDQKKSEK